MPQPNYKLAAFKIGEALKWHVVIREITNVGEAVFSFRKQNFPNDTITSSRSFEIYCWIMTLAKQKLSEEERRDLLLNFCKNISPKEQFEDINQILKDCGILKGGEVSLEFSNRKFHPVIHKHSKKLFHDGHYFHAVFEAAKAYNKLVKSKSNENIDGKPLMLKVWGAENGVLKITACETQTDRDVQDGVMFLSAGLMGAIRNPTAHEPAVDWPISKEDCLDILSFISFLFRKLDDAVYYRGQK